MLDKPTNRIERFREALAARMKSFEAVLKDQVESLSPQQCKELQERIGELQSITLMFSTMFPKQERPDLSQTPGGFLITNKHGDLVPPEELGKDELVQIVRIFADHMNKLLV